MGLNYNVQGSVNYTVVGSPTIVDGVVSGFSASDYLESSANFPSSSALNGLVAQVKFTTPNDTSFYSTQLIYTKYGSAQSDGIYLGSSGRIGFYVGGTANQSGSDGNTIQPNTTYIVREVIANNYIYLYLGPNEEHLSLIASKELESFTLASEAKMWLGVKNSSSKGPFTGSIDLNQTYIKVNGQAWFGNCPVEVKHIDYGTSVGYTKVGSPTISPNGVVSGFSDSNYLQTSLGFPNSLALNGFVCQAKFTMPSAELTNSGYLLSIFFTSTADGLFITTSRRIQFTVGGSALMSDPYVLELGGTYVARGVFTPTMKYIYLGPDEEHLVQVASGSVSTITPSTPRNTRIGRGSGSGNPFSGSIDINQTYIKVNGKLWFFKPTTNYLVKDGKLIWADSGIYIDDNGTKTYASSNIAPVPSGFTFGTTTTTDVGYVDITTQTFTAVPGATWGKD